MPDLYRRYQRDTNELPFSFAVTRTRTFHTQMPDGIPYDNDDADRICDELLELGPSPSDVQMPVADGLGGLVYEGIDVTFHDDPREDYEIMLDIEDAIKRGLVNRAFTTPTQRS